MSSEDAEFVELLARVRDRTPGAVDELVEKYGDHVVRAVRRRLHPKLRRRYDSADFTQAVWKSFFEDLALVERFDRPEGLIAFLARMAEHKVIDQVRARLETRKHDLRREQEYPAEALQTIGPTPSQVAVANETLERLLAAEPSHYQGIVDMRRGGMTCGEIADQLGVNEKTVRRVFRRMREQLDS